MSNQETSEKLSNIIKQQELLQQQQASLKAQEDALKKELASLQKIEKDERQQTITQYVQNWIQNYIQNHDLKGYNFEYNPTKMTIYYYNDKQSITAVCESFKNDSLETISTKLEKLDQILQPYHVVYDYVTHIQKHLSEQFFIDDNNPYIEYDKETNQYKIKLTVYSYKEDVTRTCSSTIELSIAYVNGIVNMSILYIPDSYNKHRSIIRIDDHTLIKPSSFMTFYFADVPGSDTESIVEMDITDYEPFQIKIAEANRNSYHGYAIFYHYRTNSNEPWKSFEPSIKEIRVDDTNFEQILIDFRQFTITVPVSKLDFHLSCYDDYLDIMNQIKKIRFEKSDKLI